MYRSLRLIVPTLLHLTNHLPRNLEIVNPGRHSNMDHGMPYRPQDLLFSQPVVYGTSGECGELRASVQGHQDANILQADLLGRGPGRVQLQQTSTTKSWPGFVKGS